MRTYEPETAPVGTDDESSFPRQLERQDTAAQVAGLTFWASQGSVPAHLGSSSGSEPLPDLGGDFREVRAMPKEWIADLVLQSLYLTDIRIVTGRRELFEQLADQWELDTRHLSNVLEIVTHRNYQRIIGLGPVAVPWILQRLQSHPGLWFWALESITGENPVPEEHRGHLSAMAQDWVLWGREKGHLSRHAEPELWPTR